MIMEEIAVLAEMVLNFWACHCEDPDVEVDEAISWHAGDLLVPCHDSGTPLLFKNALS